MQVSRRWQPVRCIHSNLNGRHLRRFIRSGRQLREGWQPRIERLEDLFASRVALSNGFCRLKKVASEEVDHAKVRFCDILLRNRHDIVGDITTLELVLGMLGSDVAMERI